MNLINEAREVIDKEISALEKTRDSLDQDFLTIVDLVHNCKGKVIITGMGKPGHVATKIAATMASLGTPSFYMHPGEAMHGDLGMVTSDDVVILMSYSGESEEVVRLLPVLDEIKCPTIAITGNASSTLARNSQYVFCFPHFEEACYMGLAPTSSTTALLALGDSLAVVLARLRNYSKADFALHHPAGALGKKLLIKVSNLMRIGDENAVVPEGSSLQSAIIEMSKKGLSMVNITDQDMRLKGIITDGDLRRMLERKIDVYSVHVDDVMTVHPKYIDEKELAVNALQKMNDHRITGMPVLDLDGKVVGSILMQDIYKAGIVNEH